MSHPTCSCSQPFDHLPTNQSVGDKHELIRHALNSDILDKENREQREEVQEYIEDGKQL
jgi:hypothetical protein